MITGDWLEVNGQQPEDKWILAFNGHWIGVAKFTKKDEEDYEPEWQDETSEYITPYPTHWMLLPPPPKTTL